MAITITADYMASDLTSHRARWRPDATATQGGAWVCSRCPARLLTRSQATTAMVLAEVEAQGGGDGARAAAFRAELGIR